ncbi:MAG: hypothetical protein GY898_11190 [Proteobacteria bacterium]|nr:hypothetical protein [Pseudomonadota bacterium]
MPGDPSGAISFHGSGGSGNFDPDLFLGGQRTNALIRHAQVTVAVAAGAGDTRLFLSSVISTWEDAVLYVRWGNAGTWSTRVTDFSTGSSWIDLLDPLPTSMAIGDQVWSYLNTYMNPYKDTTPLESALGIDVYSGCYVVYNNAYGTLSDFRLWIEDLDPGPVTHQIAATNWMNQNLVTIPNETTPPDLTGFLSGGGAGRFIDAGTYVGGSPQVSFSAGSIGFWIRRLGPANAVRRRGHMVAIVGEDPVAGYSSKLLLDWNTDGFTPVLELTHAPSVYLRGGARFKATVRGQETGLLVPNVPVGFSQTAGPGTLQQPAPPGETDENGEVSASYAAPTNIGEIGNTVTVEAQV